MLCIPTINCVFFFKQNTAYELLISDWSSDVCSSDLFAAFFSGRCDAFTADASLLAATRATNARNPDDFTILPEIISQEPLGPMVRHGADQWLDRKRVWEGKRVSVRVELGGRSNIKKNKFINKANNVVLNT